MYYFLARPPSLARRRSPAAPLLLIVHSSQYIHSSTFSLVLLIVAVPPEATREYQVEKKLCTPKDLLLWRRLEYDFLACLFLCLGSYFFFFVFLFFILLLFFPASRYVDLLRVPSSVQRSATLSKYYFIVRVLSVSFCEKF